MNLAYYGQKGTLCAHVWPPYAYEIGKLDSADVVSEVMRTLSGMFGRELPKPVDSYVQAWDQDPFALGSYSFTKRGTADEVRKGFAEPHPSAENARVYFAGEHAVVANQCVTSAYYSGLRAANALLAKFGLPHAPSEIFPHSEKHIPSVPEIYDLP